MKKLLLAIFISTTTLAQEVTPQQVLDKYFDAIGGKANIEKIVDFSAQLESEIQGQDFVMKFAKKSPKKLLLVNTLGGMELQKIVFDGTSAKVAAQGKEQVIDGENAKAFIPETALIPELAFFYEGITLTSLPDETINGEECNVIKVDGMPGISNQKEYFSKNTGLKVRQDKDTPFGNTVIYFSNYKEQSPGIKFAMDWKQEVMGMEIDLTVTSVKFNSNIADSEFTVK